MTGDDDPDLAQARMFMVLLHQEIAELSEKIKAAEHGLDGYNTYTATIIE